MVLSLIAIAVILLAMPASLGLVSSWNSAVSNQYVVYKEFNNETSAVTGATYDLPIAHKNVYSHWNATDVRENVEETIYGKSLFNDSYYRAILSASDTTDSPSHPDMFLLSLNLTTADALANGADRIGVHFDAGKQVVVSMWYQGADTYGTMVAHCHTLNATNNYTTTVAIDPVEYLVAENAEGKNGHFTLLVQSSNETTELSPGDTIIFTWQFLKKNGNIATIYTVDNLMLVWGAFLIILAFASTPFFNPLSRDVFPIINKYKRSKAARKASESRSKRTKRKKSKRRRR